ncbi:hypothetical protein P0D88_37460, partial [Paraburkholderia sp. RL18-103-BIB-C]|uniref:hypothetical protein n=1 Tax=Paraburkholderia sp. RL18-103-BIB-C TaxID=3031637 RepID=UPI0038B92336
RGEEARRRGQGGDESDRTQEALKRFHRLNRAHRVRSYVPVARGLRFIAATRAWMCALVCAGAADS